MSFTSLSIKKLLFILAVLTLSSFILQYTALAEISGDCKNKCNDNGAQKSVYYCSITDAVVDAAKLIPYSCESKCIRLNGDCNFNKNYCLEKTEQFQSPSNVYNPYCFADFFFLKYPLEQSNVEDLFEVKLPSLHIDNLIELFEYSYLSSAWFGTEISVNIQILMDNLNLLQSKTLYELSAITSSRTFARANQNDNDILTTVLNEYTSSTTSTMPFDNNFYCPTENTCSIKGNSDSFVLNLMGMELPLGQFKKTSTLKKEVAITYDDPNSMMKITSRAALQVEKIDVSCGDKEMEVSFWSQGAIFECNSLNGPHAIITPGATMDYAGYSIRNNGNDAVNIYWGGDKNKEGIVIDETDGIKFYFNNVNGLIITKGCAKITVNDVPDSEDSCISAGKSVGECKQQDFKFECSNGITGTANDKCLITENLPIILEDPTLDNYCYDFGKDSESNENIPCPCDIPGSPIGSTGATGLTECGEAVGLTAEEDMTIAELKSIYPSCTICPSSEGMNQHICDRLVNAIMGVSGKSREEVLSDPASQKRIKTEVLKIIETCRSGGTTGCKGEGAIGAIGGASGKALESCQNVGVRQEYCDTEEEFVTGNSVTITCREGRGATAFVTYDKTPCSSHNTELFFEPSNPPFKILKSMICDAAGKTMVVEVTPNTMFGFGVFGGTPCMPGGKGGGLVAASPKGSCPIEANTGCSGDIGSGAGEGLWKKLCDIPGYDRAKSMGDAIEFNGNFFVGLKDVEPSPHARIYRIKADGSCFEQDFALPDSGAGEAIGTFFVFKNKLYAGTEDKGGLFRMDSLSNWNLVNQPGDNVYFAGAQINNVLYWGTGQPAEIWKSSIGNRGSWQKVYENSIYGFYDAESFNNVAYMIGYSGSDSKKAIVLKFDGSKVVKTIELSDGYGWPGIVAGDKLYVGVRQPGSIYRIGTNDAAEKVFTGGSDVHRLALSGETIFAAIDNTIYKSDDGITWVQDKTFSGAAKTVGVFEGKIYAFITIGENDGVEAWVREIDSIPENKCTDNDKDGYNLYDKEKCPVIPSETDCDDNNKNIYPGAAEVCGNEIDEDCNNVKETCQDQCTDNDKDGYCSDASTDKDCNDNDAGIHPKATELCNDNIDQNCNGDKEDCVQCREGDDILCIGQASNAEDKTCSYHKLCSAGGIFGSCIKIDSGCQEHGSCLKDQITSCPRQFGVCAGAKQKCGSDNKWPGCDYSEIDSYSSSELCNDFIDNDCDGSVDEGCNCYGAADIDCGSNVGECSKMAGKQKCESSKWSLCKNYWRPKQDSGNNKDDDCDGSVDEWTSCAKYKDGFEKSCGLNSCSSDGKQYCSKDIDNALKFTECTGSVVPMFETCQDDLDNDCDGSINEGCGCLNDETRECGINDKGICEKGEQSCVNGLLSTCQGAVTPKEEICNELDDNCDGSIDEDCPCIDPITEANITSKPCDLQQGVCNGMNQTCVNGAFAKCEYSNVYSYQKDKETKCDDLFDNDCDGKIDDEDIDCKDVSDSKCSDGTALGKCSSTKPYYCASDLLEERCNTCYCPTNKLCNANGKCAADTCGNGRCETGERDACPGDCPKIKGEIDSDDDGLNDDEENSRGTNPYSKDTDADLKNDADDETPLCNDNGVCDSEIDYPETAANCNDCMNAEKESNCLIWPGLALLIVGFIISYFAYKGSMKLKKEKKELAGMEKTQPLAAKEKRTAIESGKKKLNNKMISASAILILGLLLIIVYFAGSEPLISCSINIILAALILLGFAGYLIYNYYIGKKQVKKSPAVEVIRPIGEIKKAMEEHKNIEQLNQFARNALERGMKESMIRNTCINVGWGNSEIDNALGKAKTRMDADKYKSLEDYIKKSLGKKIKESEIKDKLLKSGWRKDIIDSVFEKIKKQER